MHVSSRIFILFAIGITLLSLDAQEIKREGIPYIISPCVIKTTEQLMTSQEKSLETLLSLPQSIQFTGSSMDDAQSSTPPDSMGVVGPNQFVLACNGRFRTFRKTSPAGLDGGLDIISEIFFSPLALGTPYFQEEGFAFTTDPSIRFDRDLNCWFIVMLDSNLQTTLVTPAGNNNVYIAVSDTSTISSATHWNIFHFNPSVLAGVPSTTVYVADQPKLGIDSRSLYIGVDIFTTGGVFLEDNAFVINKQDLFNNLPTTVFPFVHLPFGTHGVDVFDANNPNGFFMTANESLSANALNLFVVTYTTNNTPIISNDITIPVEQFANPPFDIPQEPVITLPPLPLEAQDDRLSNVHVRDGLLYTSHNVGVNSTGTSTGSLDRIGSRWYEIDISNLANITVRQTGTAFDSSATNPNNFWMPSIMTNGLHSFVLGCSSCGTSHFANATYFQHLFSDPLNTLSSPVIYTNSHEIHATSLVPPSRWGDYSYSSLDPNDNMTLWTIQEFANPRDCHVYFVPTPFLGIGNNFGTEVISILAGPPATIISSTPSSIPSGSSTIVPLMITGLSVNGSAFYDPGPTFPNRLQVTIDDLTIHSVNVISPTKIQVNVSTEHASPGSKTITVINPDGQITQASGLLLLT